MTRSIFRFIDAGLAIRLLGVVLLAIGLTLGVNPELVSNTPVPDDVFKAVERRVWWGVLIGLGILPFFHRQLSPWLLTVVAVGCAITLGILLARLLGIVLDGSVLKQWIWAAVELVVLVVLIISYSKLRT